MPQNASVASQIQIELPRGADFEKMESSANGFRLSFSEPPLPRHSSPHTVVRRSRYDPSGRGSSPLLPASNADKTSRVIDGSFQKDK